MTSAPIPVLSLPDARERLLSLKAVLFDLDGVLTPTADVHMAAWARLFSPYLVSRDITEPYTDEDYFAHVDGKPRYDGVHDLLTARGIDLPHGDPGDGPELDTVCGLGNRKNDFFAAALAAEGVEPYEGSVVLLDHLEAIGTWDPRAGEGKLVIDRARYDFWLTKGARPSELMAQLVHKHGAAEPVAAAAAKH